MRQAGLSFHRGQQYYCCYPFTGARTTISYQFGGMNNIRKRGVFFFFFINTPRRRESNCIVIIIFSRVFQHCYY